MSERPLQIATPNSIGQYERLEAGGIKSFIGATITRESGAMPSFTARYSFDGGILKTYQQVGYRTNCLGLVVPWVDRWTETETFCAEILKPDHGDVVGHKQIGRFPLGFDKLSEAVYARRVGRLLRKSDWLVQRPQQLRQFDTWEEGMARAGKNFAL